MGQVSFKLQNSDYDWAVPGCRLVQTDKRTEHREREELDIRRGFDFLYRETAMEKIAKILL